MRGRDCKQAHRSSVRQADRKPDYIQIVMDDFFADLLPSKSNADQSKAGNSSNASNQEDAVLPSRLDSPKSGVSQTSADLMSGDNHKAQPGHGHVPMGEPKMRKDLKEYQQIIQGVVQDALKKFSGDLQRTLEEISRQACLL